MESDGYTFFIITVLAQVDRICNRRSGLWRSGRSCCRESGGHLWRRLFSQTTRFLSSAASVIHTVIATSFVVGTRGQGICWGRWHTFLAAADAAATAKPFRPRARLFAQKARQIQFLLQGVGKSARSATPCHFFSRSINNSALPVDYYTYTSSARFRIVVESF
jgi:hypothetical protein